MSGSVADQFVATGVKLERDEISHELSEPQMYSCKSDDDRQMSGVGGCVCCVPVIQSVNHRINAGLSRRGFVSGMGASRAAIGFVRLAGSNSRI